MNQCCMRYEATRFVRERFRVMDEGEGFTCPTCGTVHRVVKGKWMESPPTASTLALYTDKDTTIDLGWARAVRDKGTLIVTCWGCGAVNVYTERGLTEVHFDHATPDCTIEKALTNHERGVMPTVTKH